MDGVTDGIRTIASAIGASLLGLWLVQTTVGERDTPSGRPTATEIGVEGDAPPARIATPTPADASTQEQTDVGAPKLAEQLRESPRALPTPSELPSSESAPSEPTPSEPPSVKPTTTTPPAASSFSHGRVAYLRCTLPSGAPAEDARNCPRARETERQVWAILEQISTCDALKARVGHGDVRLDFSETIPRARFFDRRFAVPSAVKNLPARDVLACVEPALEQLAQPADGLRPVISFRFELR